MSEGYANQLRHTEKQYEYLRTIGAAGEPELRELLVSAWKNKKNKDGAVLAQLPRASSLTELQDRLELGMVAIQDQVAELSGGPFKVS
jgi:hypothetical protein